MNCSKLLSQSLMARAFDRQVAEVQIRATILNRFTALGTPVTAAVALTATGRAGLYPKLDLRKKPSSVFVEMLTMSRSDYAVIF